MRQSCNNLVFFCGERGTFKLKKVLDCNKWMTFIAGKILTSIGFEEWQWFSMVSNQTIHWFKQTFRSIWVLNTYWANHLRGRKVSCEEKCSPDTGFHSHCSPLSCITGFQELFTKRNIPPRLWGSRQFCPRAPPCPGPSRWCGQDPSGNSPRGPRALPLFPPEARSVDFVTVSRSH